MLCDIALVLQCSMDVQWTWEEEAEQQAKYNLYQYGRTTCPACEDEVQRVYVVLFDRTNTGCDSSPYIV